MSASRATETDAIEFFLNHPGMYIDPQSQPTQAGNDECWKNLLRRTSVLGQICESMHDGRSHLDATCDGNPYDTCCNVLGRIDETHREILECNPPRFMTQLPCPGEPVVDFIFAGDSSMALVDEGLYADGTVKRTKRNVGEFLKAGRMDLLTEKAGSAQYSMHWGKGLKDITDGIEACLRRTPGGVAPAVVVVSYAGNDVYGNYGYVGNPWVDTQVLHRNPAKQQAAYAWQAEMAESHTQQMRRLADLRQRKDVAALIVICYCDGQSYGLPEDFTRQMVLVSEAFKKMGVMTVAGTTLVRSCTRYDSFHCLNTDANRNLFVRYYASVALFAYYYWVLAGVDILRRDANLFAKQRGNKTRKALMRERVWNKRFDEGYLCLGDWYEPFPGELRQHAITGTGKKVALTEFEEIAILDDWGEWEDATQDEIEAARKLPFNVRAYQQRGTAGQWLIPTAAEWGAPSGAPTPKEDDKMEVDEPKVIEIDEVFEPPTTTPPGTDGRDQNNQAPASAAGMEFVTAKLPVPADGDKEFVPPVLTEEDELLMMNDPLDDEEQILELLQPHIAAAERQGHENVDQPDDDEDPDEEILFDTPILTHLPDSMRDEGFKAQGVLYQLRLNPEEPDIVRIYTDEDSIPALEGEALRKFKQVTDFQGGAASGVKDKKGTKIRTAEVPPAKRTGAEQPQEPKPKASKKSSEETASSSSDVRPAGAEAAAVEKPTSKPQPKPSERPAGAVADSTTPATEKPAIQAKVMPKAPSKAPPMPKGATSPLSENQVVALQSREVPGASRLDHLSSDQVWLSRRISGLLRGWEHTNKRNRVPPPAFQKGLWMEFSHVYMYIKKKYRQSLTIDDMLVVITSNHRFMMEIKVAPKGTLVGGKRPYTPMRLKAIQHHNDWSYQNVEEALPEHERFIVLDPEYGVAEYNSGKFPRMPVNAHGRVEDIQPTIVYHYTHHASIQDIINMGLIPGGNRTGDMYSFLTKEDPWSTSTTDYAAMASTRPVCIALDLHMMAVHGYRLVETTAGTILCPDWISCRYVIFVYDMSNACYLYANHVYAHYRAIFQKKKKAFFEARSGGPLAGDEELIASKLESSTKDVLDDYEKWCGKVTTFHPFIFGGQYEVQGVKDQMKAGKNLPDLKVLETMYVTRRPNFRANRNYVSPTEMLPNYNRPRFDFRACDPAKEGYGKTQWLVVEGIQMPEGHCPTCEIHFTFGTMSCGQCGTFSNTASDLCKAAQVIRMEELASEMGVELSLDMVQEDRLQGTGIRNTPAGTHGHDPRANRSGINILKTNARSHVNKADKLGMTISQRQLTDPLYAFNCAAQDLSPLCISFLEKLANAVIPDPPRTHQMIMQGVGHRYAGKLIYINDPEKVGEADMSKDFLVYWKNRLYRPEIFAASYAQSTKRPPILGFHSEWKTDEKDPDELLQLLLDFIAEDIAFIPNVNLQLGYGSSSSEGRIRISESPCEGCTGSGTCSRRLAPNPMVIRIFIVESRPGLEPRMVAGSLKPMAA